MVKVTKRSELESLRTENELLLKKITELEKDNRVLNKKLLDIQDGKRCTGKYCDHCKNWGGEKVVMVNGVVNRTERVCLLDVPCKDFERMNCTPVKIG